MTQDHVTSERLRLRPFEKSDLTAFAALHSDPEVMQDLGGPISRDAAQAKLASYMASYERHGHGRLAVFCEGAFAGYAGVMHRDSPGHPLGTHKEIGWRLNRAMWGRGIATEAARLCLQHAISVRGLRDVLCYALPENTRSHAVIARLGLRRAPELDFTEIDPDIGRWHGWVWRVPYPDFVGGIE